MPYLPVGRLRVALLVAMLGVAVSAQAALRAIVAHHHVPAAEAPITVGYDVQDHFPGAALLYAADEQAAPAAGTTGTIALPALPKAQAAILADAPADTSIHPAPPFSLAHIAPLDRGRALQCLASAIYYEAASEPDAGQAAVAQVILNRVRHPAFPGTVCGVVYQGSEHAGCQFSFACDGSMARVPMKSAWLRALGNAARALNGHVEAEVGMATHYHTYAVTPRWNRQLVMTAAIGAHFFHRWSGWWGTPAAFRQVYAGNEPLPGPHAPIAAPVLALDAAVPVGAAPLLAPAPRTAPTAIQPAYAEASLPRTRTVTTPTTNDAPALPESTMLDKWRGTGQPLR